MWVLVDLVCRPISYFIFIKLIMYPRKYLKNKDQFFTPMVGGIAEIPIYLYRMVQ